MERRQSWPCFPSRAHAHLSSAHRVNRPVLPKGEAAPSQPCSHLSHVIHSTPFFLFTVLRCYCSLVAPLYDITVTRWWEGLSRVCLNTVSAVLCRTGTAHPFFFFFLFRSPNCRKSLSLSLDCVLAVMRIP